MPRNPYSSQQAAPSGSQTEVTDVQSQSSNSDAQQPQITGTLRLRGYRTETNADGRPERRIRWAEDVVDNEGQGKKSSKGMLIVKLNMTAFNQGHILKSQQSERTRVIFFLRANHLFLFSKSQYAAFTTDPAWLEKTARTRTRTPHHRPPIAMRVAIVTRIMATPERVVAQPVDVDKIAVMAIATALSIITTRPVTIDRRRRSVRVGNLHQTLTSDSRDS